MTTALDRAQIPKMVNSQPLPIVTMSGAATMDPVPDKTLRTKLFNATPDEDL
jgi:hypothetical protein